MSAEPREGWAFPGNSRKAHFMRDAMSLCGKWGLYFGRLQQDNGKPGPDDCAGCRKVLDKERAAVSAAAAPENQT